jgi:hypothetical protein
VQLDDSIIVKVHTSHLLFDHSLNLEGQGAITPGKQNNTHTWAAQGSTGNEDRAHVSGD